MGWFKDKKFDKDKVLYGGLIITFAFLYLATAFVSWYHSITFFNIANATWLSVLLSFVAEIGQASVLFSILLTENKNKFLPWVIMVVLTTLQVIGNVVSSYDWIIQHNSAGVEGFQKSILFWLQTGDPEMFKVIIAWISGSLLPIIALSMTALVAQNLSFRANSKKIEEPELDPSYLMSNFMKMTPTEEELKRAEEILSKKKPDGYFEKEMPLKKEVVPALSDEEVNKMTLDDWERTGSYLDEDVETLTPEVKPEIKNEVEKIKDLMYKTPTTTVIPKDRAKDIAPGVDNYEEEIKNDDTLKSAVEETIKEFSKSHHIPTNLPHTPEVIPAPETPELVVTQNNGLVELSPDPSPEIKPLTENKGVHSVVGTGGLSGSSGISPEAIKAEEERLERLRAIARENSKKK